MWYSKTNQRLRDWYEFRQDLGNKSLTEALTATAKLWGTAPFVNYSLDPGKPQTWPSPWELLDDNYYCDISLALGMFYTLALSDHSTDLKLDILYDPEKKEQINIVVVNSEYVLNYYPSEVVNKSTHQLHFQVRYSYNTSDLQIASY
jgi:hypothetical protein